MAEDDSTIGKVLGNIGKGASTGKPKYTTYPPAESHEKALKRITATPKRSKFLQPSDPADNPNRRM